MLSLQDAPICKHPWAMQKRYTSNKIDKDLWKIVSPSAVDASLALRYSYGRLLRHGQHDIAQQQH